jgi:hypothetical protein
MRCCCRCSNAVREEIGNFYEVKPSKIYGMVGSNPKLKKLPTPKRASKELENVFLLAVGTSGVNEGKTFGGKLGTITDAHAIRRR